MIDKIIELKPFEFSISYNEHHSSFESVKDYYAKDDFISEEEYNKCKETDIVFEGRLYPNNSVGFYNVCASEYEKVLETLYNILIEERKIK